MNLYLSMIRFNCKIITGLRILDLRLKGAVIGKNDKIAGSSAKNIGIRN